MSARRHPAQEVEVPEDFRRLGFSGLFWQEVELDPDIWKAKAPCLISRDRWLLLEVSGTHGVIVRKDENAIVDVFTGRPKRGLL